MIYVLGFIVRLAYMLHYPGRYEIPPGTNDEFEYNQIAMNLLSGNGYRISGEHLDFDGELRSYRAPGYSLFLAIVFGTFGHSYFAVRIIQCVIGAATCCIIYLIGESFQKKIGVAAGLYSVFYTDLLIHSSFIIAETIHIFFLSGSLLLFLRMDCNRGRQLFAGIFWGLAAMVKTQVVVLTPFILLWTFIRYSGRQALIAGILVFLGFSAIVGPWVARNYAIHNALVLTSDFGRVFWGNNNPYSATGVSALKPLNFRKYFFIKEEVAQSRAFASEGAAYLKGLTPLQIAVFSTKKMAAFLYPFKSDRDDSWYNFTYGFIFPFWILGMFLAVREWDPKGLLFLAHAFSSFGSVILTAGVPRFRESLSPAILVLGMIALEHLFRTRPRLTYRIVGMWAAIQMLLFLFAPLIQAYLIQPFIRHLHATV